VTFEELLQTWSGEELVVRRDEPTGTWMFIGIDSTVLGPAMGGTRMRTYASPTDALADALRLSSAMTLKQAVAGLPFGGGKAVLAVSDVPRPRSGARRELLLRYASLVASLGGTYVTAADMNTGQEDMDVIGERCSHVLGRSPEAGGAGDPAPSTAIGVFHGIVSAVQHVWSSPDLQDRSVLIQGVGAVGGRLAELLGEAGARLVIADTDPGRAKEIAERVGGSVVEVDHVIGTECDVFSPCATGGVISTQTVPALRCRVIAGAANNQLASDGDADRLSEAGVLYAPDYLINAGGVLHLAGYETLGWSEEQMSSRLAGIGRTLAEVFESSKRRGISTDRAARELAAARIRAGTPS
jgi:leucine dehydrogenase